jgi:hypothetical protein
MKIRWILYLQLAVLVCCRAQDASSKALIKTCKERYVDYLKGKGQHTDCLESVSNRKLDSLLEQATFELGHLPPVSVYWYSRTKREDFWNKVGVDSIFLNEKDSCRASLWRAVYYYKGEELPKGSPQIECPLIDTLILDRSSVDSLRMTIIYDTYSGFFGY